MAWLIYPLVFLILAGYEWARYWCKIPPHPWLVTVFLAIISPFCIWRAVKAWRTMKGLSLGLRGERTVGQLLEQLRARGYRVFHDLPEDGYNIDHVLIGPGGVFAVETKTRSKRRRGSPKVIYDGQRLTVDGHVPDRDPLVQAKAAARRVHHILQERTGRQVFVQPVVLFPGWWVEVRTQKTDIIVTNDKLFLMTFERLYAKPVLEQADVDLYAQTLDRYLRDRYLRTK